MTQKAVESLMSCLLEMAQAETNPVLQVIPSDSAIEENKKYPKNLLQFNELGWRAYYHCHPASRAGNHRFQGEHGHFHIFVRINSNPDRWTHLVALAINNMGQPIGLFTVNQWVTGEEWENADNLIVYLKNIPYEEQAGLVEKWLLSFLDISKGFVKSILYERDKLIELKQKESPESDVKKDRRVYVLSEITIDLKKLLDIKADG